MSITVYGASDDLIEIEGSVREEFSAYGDEPSYLAFSTGTVLRISYSDSGVWRIVPVVGEAHIVQAPEDDEVNYSDRATVEGAVWVVRGSEIAK